ncbi:MAG: DUF928 domain-containing protein [Mastigocoleus sp. MO_167.B18]|uniref:DUF928 domain-containing protein n=1 Tax=Mastigocoleus sp. MO_188.B34 TaxID=3036635 RepID=UPI002606A0C8|nr:DUF928 domain-containing protein [Mastigocoleus sp. MO_188.B34]MDJ0696019.1 DUF928 domain-containing protein [Mastigocoleus sp. MO_188.B34]MDJ0772075.1 DUF928 domain-containing protein [Mastigocoleus sp. MO_167.B18]
MMKKYLIHKLFIVTLLTSFITISPSVLAAYVPPPDQKESSDYSKPGGRRGCDTSKIPLTVLAPKKYVGYTFSSHPTFAWYSSGSESVEFSLFKFDKNGDPEPLGSPINTKKAPGIQTYSLPKNQPGLQIGETYLWQVIITCPQGLLLSRAEFTVVPLTTELSKKIAQTSNELDRLNLYAQSSLWYDALAEALTLAKTKGLTKPLSSLLENVADGDIPHEGINLTKPEIEGLKKHVENLQNIAAIKDIQIN